MTWIRRNWPDLLIVLFILALIAGFVVVLMGGAGSLFGNRNSSPSSVVETPAPSSTPSAKPTPSPAPAQDPVAAAPGTEPVTKPVTEPSSSQPDTAKPFPTPEPNSSTPAPATATGSTPADSVKPDAIPVIPAQTTKPSSSTAGSSTPETKPAVATPTVETVLVRPAPQVETKPAQPVAKPTVETAPVRPAPRVETTPAQPTVRAPRVQASGSGIPTKSDYRISAGLYSSSAAAEEVASKIRGLGYPVHVVPSKDDTEVVLVGPFGNRRDANAASGDISRVHQNLFVYAPSSDGTSGSASSSDNSNTSSNTPTASDSNSSTPSSGNTASDTPASGTLYLQVGAFGSQSSADTLMEKLRSSGYSPRTRIGSSGLVRVVVGPFAAAEIDGAKSKLSSEGVDSFTVRSN